MNLLSPTFLAWLLPATYLIHLLEEHLGGEGFPVWLSRFMNANLSAADFLLINGIIHSFGGLSGAASLVEAPTGWVTDCFQGQRMHECTYTRLCKPLTASPPGPAAAPPAWGGWCGVAAGC